MKRGAISTWVALKKTQNINNTFLKLKSLNIMKKKIILTLTASLFAAGSIINVHLAHNDHNLDVSLADISVMAQADGESEGTPDYKMFTYSCYAGPHCTTAWFKRCEPYPGEQCSVSDQHSCGCPGVA